jgi:hypothetical protein
MPRATYTIEGIGKVTVTDNNYLADGGEATVYATNKLAIKIYHDSTRMIPLQKIEELRQIKDKHVLVPEHIVYKGSSSPVGYATPFKPNTYPLCKLFTKAFKNKNNIGGETINNLISQMQITINNIHGADCLVVDLNEMNEMVSPKFAHVYFIDVDSYETPSFRATAIMESIRDRKVKKQLWHKGSDWFSFAILSFQMWIGIHPYKGKHPDFKPNEWIERMNKGVSVFDPKVILPRSCADLSVIPKSHLGWLKDVFVNDARCAPPEMGDAIAIVVPTSFKFVTASKAFDTKFIEKCNENIKSVFNFVGVNYFIGEKNIHKGRAILPVNIVGADHVLMCESEGVDPIVCIQKGNEVSFSSGAGQEFGRISANSMMQRNGCIYTSFDGKLIENTFIRMGNRLIHSTRQAASVMDLSTQMFSGVIIQDLLGRKYITIPYGKGLCAHLSVKELDGCRVLDAKSERNFCAIMAEKGGKYYRFVLIFNSAYNQYTIRIAEDITYTEINLTVLPNGVAILALEDSVEIFKDTNVKTVDNPPFDSTKRIFNISGVIHFVDGKELHRTKMKS